jgi:gluconolactonase
MIPRKMIALAAMLALAFLCSHSQLHSQGKHGIDTKIEKQKKVLATAISKMEAGAKELEKKKSLFPFVISKEDLEIFQEAFRELKNQVEVEKNKLELLLQTNGKNDIVPEGAKLEKIFDGGVVLTEGVAVAPDNMVYFSDITFSHVAKDKKGVIEAGHIWKYNPKTGKTTIFRSPSGMSNGIKFDAAGNMIVAEGADYGGRRVIRTDMKTGKSYIIAAMFEGRPFNSPNDITIDEKGRIYFSDPRYLGHEPIDQPVQAVYRIDPDGTIHRIITDAGKPNGVCVSPDQKTIYVVSNDNGTTGLDRIPKDTPVLKGRMALLAYDLSPKGTAKFRKVLVDYAPQDGPDGLVCDAEGNIYVAVRDETRPGIYVYSSSGKELAYIKTEIPTNVGFGRGPEGKTLYITAGKSLYRIRVNKEGYQLPSK